MSKIKVHLIWDFDAAIGQVNATYPYRFSFQPIRDELKNVQYILEKADEFNFRFSFAVTGFSAESTVYPFEIKDIIKDIYSKGHEIASHSWRHEWMPIMMPQQIIKSIQRSKFILEDCIGVPGAVVGFVPPHNRPMTWVQKGAYSLGDRGLYPFFKGGNIDYLVSVLKDSGYSWGRFVYTKPVERVFKQDVYTSLKRGVESVRGFSIVPLHYNGFDAKAIKVIEQGVQLKKDVFICGHPSGLSRNGEEAIRHFDTFVEFLSAKSDLIDVVPVNSRYS